MKTFRPFDYILIFLILAVSVFLMRNSFSKKNQIVHIQTQNEVYEYSLDKDAVYKVQGPLGWTEVQIENRKVRITDSPCPNKTCISKGWSNPIVCLPNQIIITLDEEGDFDAVAE